MEIPFKYINEGSVQAGRKFSALHPDYVKIDELKSQDLLVILYDFSKFLTYYNQKGQVDGDFSKILQDEIFIIAQILSLDFEEFNNQFAEAYLKYNKFSRPEKKAKYLAICKDIIFKSLNTINYWYTFLKKIYPAYKEHSRTLNEISYLINEKLSPVWPDSKALLGEEYTLEDFATIWTPEEDKVKKINHSPQEIFGEIAEALLYLNQKGKALLSHNLSQNNHQPHISLLLAFLDLYKIPQQEINKLGLLHLNHYYKNILKQAPYNFKADKTYLQFQLDEGVPAVEIEENTPFVAGETADGQKLIYEADHHSVITQAEAKKAGVYYASKQRGIYKGKNFEIIKSLYAKEFEVQPYSEKEKEVHETQIPPFGEEQERQNEVNFLMDEGTLGLTLASPLFYLSEGNRNINIKFQLTEATFTSFRKLITKLKADDSESFEVLYVKTFLDLFEIYITSPNGWFNIEEKKITIDQEKNILGVNITLNENEPSWAAYQKNIHQKNGIENTPLLYLKVKNDNYIYGYSLLQPLVFASIFIKTDVKLSQSLTAYNQIGQLNTDAPFQPFGPTPKKGSYLLLGNNEIFQKAIDTLDIQIKWYQIPELADGMYGHYQSYPLEWDNSTFKAKVYLLQEGKWKLIPDGEKFLFQTTDRNQEKPQEKGPLKPTTFWKFGRVSNLEIPHHFQNIHEKTQFDKLTKRGFIKIELENPSEGFGHLVYPSVLTEVTTHNAKSSFFSKTKEKPVPLAPYTPQIEKITLNYSASQEIHGLDETQIKGKEDQHFGMYHFHPFGYEKIFPNEKSLIPSFLPAIDYDGAFHIGLDKVHAPETVNLFFEMSDASTATSEDIPPTIVWSYLSNNEWHQLPSGAILLDTTKGFLKSGIIRLSLPEKIKKGNTIMDDQLYWLRASAKGNIHVSSKIKKISTQFISVTASSSTDIGQKYEDQYLPEYQIKRGMVHFKGVKKIQQPLASYGGIPAENHENFTFRIAERLRHKKRAITSWDFERLVLEKFHELNHAHCLQNLSTKSEDVSNSILMIVSPKSSHKGHQERMVSSEMLYQIKQFLQELTTPFCNIEVSNPTYERIKILTAVRFKSGQNNGYSIQKLQTAISDYINGPYAQDNPINLGGHINIADVLSYLRTLPYVAHITRFSIVQTAQKYNGQFTLIDTAREGESKDRLKATKPWSILISAKQHQIELIEEGEDIKAEQAGISHLSLGDDFIIED
ncbi:hypothetical protein [Persicobacter diffluens]|uniref:Baseplate protein J-like domain-containing protein n=1 Tax=Persicobacter diffluens TaxID=981 RepID=A0AAN5AP49_9BACT|nr:hypothetical protein PEDI_40000 [Persicobacter diffluens]